MYYPRNDCESMDHPRWHLFQGHKESLLMVELEQRLHCIYRNLGQAELYAHKPTNYLINEDDMI